MRKVSRVERVAIGLYRTFPVATAASKKFSRLTTDWSGPGYAASTTMCFAKYGRHAAVLPKPRGDTGVKWELRCEKGKKGGDGDGDGCAVVQ
jgi:hypothetical protein